MVALTAARAPGTGLVRVTVATARRRLDVALPEYVRVAELLPVLLGHVGETAADDGEEHGGWVLYRADGTPVRVEESLAHQHVLDGEVLHLAPRVADWPEPEFDDVIEAIAVGARGYKATWTMATTRRAGLVAAAVLLPAGLVPVLMAGPPWPVPAAVASVVGGLLLCLSAALARAFADAVAGAACGALAALYASVGGGLVLAGDRGLTRLDPAHGLLAAAALLTVSLLAAIAVGRVERVLVAGTVCGVAGVIAAAAGLATLSPAAVAGVVLSIVVLAVPATPLLAIRLGRLPLPELARTPEQLLQDRPVPEVGTVFAAVARADEALTGLVGGLCLVALAAQATLVATGSAAGLILAAVTALSLLLRSRAFPAVRQRAALLAAGALGLIGPAVVAGSTLGPVGRAVVLSGGAAVLGLGALAAGLAYSHRAASPYLGRFADIVDALAVVLTVPLACAVAGLLGYARGLFG